MSANSALRDVDLDFDLVQEKEAAEQRADAAEIENARLRARLARLEGRDRS